ncbi:MAG TPA: hypothetical protein VMU39_17480 [Solirubrobacteraceae bacterium]|nr:hypothetical protein [Solirubrobacteraceae bacterium]
MAASEDPTQGQEAGSQPFEDPTQGAEVGEQPYEDPTQGSGIGQQPHEDPTGPSLMVASSACGARGRALGRPAWRSGWGGIGLEAG